jgi:dUTP pyrophosphatase
MAIKFAKFRDVRDPTRATGKSAGIDFYIPQFTDEYLKVFNGYNTNAQSMAMWNTVNNTIMVRPNGQVRIPLGIMVDFSEEQDSMLMFTDKSGVSWEQRMTIIGGIVDADYQGEIMLQMFNYTAYPVGLLPGMKIVQAIRVPIFYDSFEMVSKEDIHKVKTERGTGGFGSSGK